MVQLELGVPLGLLFTGATPHAGMAHEDISGDGFWSVRLHFHMDITAWPHVSDEIE